MTPGYLSIFLKTSLFLDLQFCNNWLSINFVYFSCKGAILVLNKRILINLSLRGSCSFVIGEFHIVGAEG